MVTFPPVHTSGLILSVTFASLRPLKWQSIKLLHETWLDMETWMNKELMTKKQKTI